MPQEFQVVRCYECSTFQAHETKKSNKWDCRLCGKKQSFKRFYGIGTPKECRFHVQKLNAMRGKLVNSTESPTDEDSDEEKEGDWAVKPIKDTKQPIKRSKWSQYLDETESVDANTNENSAEYEEVVFEVPKKPTQTNSLKRNPKFSVVDISPIDATSTGDEELVCDIPKKQRKLNTKSRKTNPLLSTGTFSPVLTKVKGNLASTESKPPKRIVENSTISANSLGFEEVVCEIPKKIRKLSTKSSKINPTSSSGIFSPAIIKVEGNLASTESKPQKRIVENSPINANSSGYDEIGLEIPKKMRKLNTKFLTTNPTFSTVNIKVEGILNSTESKPIVENSPIIANSSRDEEVGFEIPKKMRKLNITSPETNPILSTVNVKVEDNVKVEGNLDCTESIPIFENSFINAYSSGYEAVVHEISKNMRKLNTKSCNTNPTVSIVNIKVEPNLDSTESKPIVKNSFFHANSSRYEEVECEISKNMTKLNTKSCNINPTISTVNIKVEPNLDSTESIPVVKNSFFHANSSRYEEVECEISKNMTKLNTKSCNINPTISTVNIKVEPNLDSTESIPVVKNSFFNANSSRYEEVECEISKNTTLSTFNFSPVIPKVEVNWATESKPPQPNIFCSKEYHPEETFNKIKLEKKFVPAPDSTDQASLLPPFEILDGMCSDSMMAKPFTWREDTADLDALNI
ncbi:hypothetical protein PYW07_014465 [Mythimna separata]|uniref:MRN complex-interacting protein N-terminal domain-containing protein n=1 Tax=Mythimna separata TaxID=271217 RepID=A0AAD8E0E3_MYTSE|nr:hypothetical protein PYW07_014465 [Mythimna separata]